jgi:hypothetical protein
MRIGFSTGSLALGDFRRGLQMARRCKAAAVELSALREVELEFLIDSLGQLDLSDFQYVSLHAPSKLQQFSEADVVKRLHVAAELSIPIVMHPDVIRSPQLWATLGAWLCIENMDKRKPTGRTAAELSTCFDRLPLATFCFDIGHARQVDPTMLEARRLLTRFRDRLRQVHMSYVNSASRHESLNHESMIAFSRVAALIGREIPIILETPVVEEMLDREMELAATVFAIHETLADRCDTRNLVCQD